MNQSMSLKILKTSHFGQAQKSCWKIEESFSNLSQLNSDWNRFIALNFHTNRVSVSCSCLQYLLQVGFLSIIFWKAYQSFLIFFIGNGYGCIYQGWIDEFWAKNYWSEISNWCCNSCCKGISLNHLMVTYQKINRPAGNYSDEWKFNFLIVCTLSSWN